MISERIANVSYEAVFVLLAGQTLHGPYWKSILCLRLQGWLYRQIESATGWWQIVHFPPSHRNGKWSRHPPIPSGMLDVRKLGEV